MFHGGTGVCKTSGFGQRQVQSLGGAPIGVVDRNGFASLCKSDSLRGHLSSILSSSTNYKESIMNAWKFLCSLHQVCKFQTKEGKKVGTASGSELKRWCQNNALQINGESMKWDEEIDFPVFSVVLFPKNEHFRTTLL